MFHSTITGEQRYYPFGETRLSTGTLYTDKLFTGQRSFADIGLYHYQARFYSPRLGRFISPDTIVPGFANPQNLNRFAYVTNNPIRYIDPTGHTSACGFNYSDPECEAPDPWTPPDDDDPPAPPPPLDDGLEQEDPAPVLVVVGTYCPTGITCTTSESSGAMGPNVNASMYAGQQQQSSIDWVGVLNTVLVIAAVVLVAAVVVWAAAAIGSAILVAAAAGSLGTGGGLLAMTAASFGVTTMSLGTVGAAAATTFGIASTGLC